MFRQAIPKYHFNYVYYFPAYIRLSSTISKMKI